MEYRGFKIKPKFDGEIYFGKLEGLADLVTVEANTLGAFENEFKAAVDDYIAFRRKLAPQSQAG